MSNNHSSKFRYEFSRIIKDEAAYLQVLDNYLASSGIVTKYLFRHEGPKEVMGYGAKMIDMILDILATAGKNSGTVSHIVIKDSKLRLDKALEELEAAIEEYDDKTGSKSEMYFKSVSKNGEVLTIDTRQY